ncbi:MAG: shikimate kinase [Microcella sp.]|uniref:shikimate kinase n=1 Tax=Microcella sp. TaxID=1913979 RepID=UPI0033157678
MPERDGTRPRASTETPSPLAVLIGAPAAGQTRIGKRVARTLSVPFLDTDALVEAEHGPIPTIFAEQGEPTFRRWEAEAVAHALGQPAIVALGGGAVMTPSTAEALRALPVVLLTITPDAVATRIGNGKRPLLAGGIERWTELVEARMPVYQSLATVQWDTSRRPTSQIAEEIATWVRTLPAHEAPGGHA